MRLAVLASGNGSNFEAIVDAVEKKQINAEIALVFSDHPTACVVKRAQNHGVPVQFFEVKDFPTKADYEQRLLTMLQEAQIDLVILAGYMRILGEPLLNAFPNKIVNIHPSLLPNFPGLHGIKDAFEAGVEKTGITIHYVDNGVDTGPIIAQQEVKIDKNETLPSLEKKIHQAEHELYPQVIAKIVEEYKNETSID